MVNRADRSGGRRESVMMRRASELPMILEVHITDPLAGTSRNLRFAQSPIRIGRNQLNDVSLDTPFVSEWHGTIRFDAQSIAYFDLGSTNGTMLDGKRLAKNVAVELSPTSRLQLGGVQVVVSVHQADSPLNQTLGWGRPDPHSPPAAFSSPPSPASSPPPSASPSQSAPPSSSPSPWPSQRSVERPPPGASGPIAAPSRPAARVPSFADEPAAPPLGAPGSGSQANAALLARQRKLLEAFSEAFVGLRKGYEQFGAEVGVRTVSGSTALHRARTSAELLDHLLDPNGDPALASRELIAVFADLGIHHIAMMEAITEAVRAVLQSLDPRANDLELASGLLTRGKTKAQWKSYIDRFDQLVTDDDELHTAIFGDDFARAYASVTLGDGGGREKKKGDPG
jgi:type VI secretion system protein ImpI